MQICTRWVPVGREQSRVEAKGTGAKATGCDHSAKQMQTHRPNDPTKDPQTR